MARVLVHQYSTHSHIEALAHAMAEGAHAGSEVLRQPSEVELAGARHQGGLVARTTGKVFG